MVVSAPAAALLLLLLALLLLLTGAVVASAAESGLTVRAIRSAVLVGTSAAAHAICAAAVKAVALKMARVSTIGTAHLGRLGGREAAALRTGSSVCGRAWPRGSERWRGARSRLGLTKGLQLVSRGSSAWLSLGAERLSLRLE